jgi:hypothetical protein
MGEKVEVKFCISFITKREIVKKMHHVYYPSALLGAWL